MFLKENKMKNKELWKPTRFIVDENNNLQVNPATLGTGSDLTRTYHLHDINRLIKTYIKGKLLDLGCGYVPFYEFYKNLITDSVCMDWANSYHQNPFIDIYHDINKPFPLPDNEFDSILCTGVLEHIYKPHDLFKECHRILKQNGNLLITSVLSYCEHEPPFDYFRNTQYFLQRIASELDFEVVELITIGDGLFVMADISEKILASTPYKDDKHLKNLNNLLKFLIEKYTDNGIPLLENFPKGHLTVLRKK